MANINEEITRIQNQILALKGFGHGEYINALKALERWTGDQRKRYISTQGNLDGTAVTPNEFEMADEPRVVSPWSLHHDATQIDLELPESPKDSQSSEINDILNLLSPEGDARAEGTNSLFVSPEHPSIDEDVDPLLLESTQSETLEGVSRIERTRSPFINPKHPSIDENFDSLLPETDQPEANTSRVPPTNYYGGTWNDITDTSPTASPLQNATAGVSDSWHKSGAILHSKSLINTSDQPRQTAAGSVHSGASISHATNGFGRSSTGNASSQASPSIATSSRGSTSNASSDDFSQASATNSHLDGFGTDARSQAGRVLGILKLDALPAIIEQAQDTFLQSRVDFLCGGKVITINPDEVNEFFSQFKEDGLLSTSAINPIVSSFAWDANTLVLHSSYMEVQETERAPERTEPRGWPITKKHGQVIVPSCYKEHWTLFHIDLNKRLVWRYNSARSSSEMSKNLKEVIQHGLKEVFSEVEPDKVLEYREAVSLGDEKSPCQSNEYDCGLYTLLNAERLSLSPPSMEDESGLVLRQRYLKVLFQHALWARHHLAIQESISGNNKPARLKRFHVAEEDEDPEESATHDTKRARNTQWEPSSRLGKSEKEWQTLRDGLAVKISRGSTDDVRNGQRADHLMRMMCAIAGKEVLAALEDTLKAAKETSEAPMGSCVATTIYNLLSRGQDRSYKDHIILRLGKYLFASRIANKVDILRSQGAPSKQRVATAGSTGSGNAVSRALGSFLGEVYPDTEHRPRDSEVRKCRQWWNEGKLWRVLAGAVDPMILLLMPSGQKSYDEQRIWDSE
ncbi:MAG: hypothetical protein L6R37_007992 [Teloschistes peruensis]|nr:MAG: hypothetical protein L6R37_007992 [Teloschistes peruensis]